MVGMTSDVTQPRMRGQVGVRGMVHVSVLNLRVSPSLVIYACTYMLYVVLYVYIGTFVADCKVGGLGGFM